MLRYTLIGLGVLLTLLVGLALLPDRQREVPEQTIMLSNATVALYPQSDPAAVWRFSAPVVDYQPDIRETTLRDIEDGARTVDGKIDFTLRSEEIVIDRSDNLTGNRIDVHLLDADWFLAMQGREAQQVLIDQARGKFLAPVLDYSGQGLGSENHAENVSVNFDLTDFVSDCRETYCVNQFEDSVSEE